MKVFVTGATGYIAQFVNKELIALGHHVVGLSRTEEGASRLKAQGVEPLLGNLKEADKLEKAAREADAVIHLGFVHDDFSDYVGALKVDRVAIDAFSKALEGTGKILIGTSGTLMVGDTQGKEVDEYATTSMKHGRAEHEQLVLDLATKNVKSMVMRLVPFVYGHNGKGFLASYIETAKKEKVVYYIGDGSGKTSATHVEDAAHAYVLALTKGQAGAIYHVVGQLGFTFKDLANAVAKLLNLEAKSIEMGEQAQKYFLMAFAFSVNSQAAPVRIKKDLDWKPSGKHDGILEDTVTGSYKVRA